MQFIRNAAYKLVFGTFFLYWMMLMIVQFGSLFLPSEMHVWFVDSRIEICKRENIFLEIFMCRGSHPSLTGQVMLFWVALGAATLAGAGWFYTSELRGRTTVSKLKYVVLTVAGIAAFFLVIWFPVRAAVGAWDTDLHEFSIDDVTGTWEPRYQGNVVSLTLRADGQYVYKVVTKQSGTFENANEWKIIVLQPDDIPELPPESKILVLSSFLTKHEFDKCEAQQTPCQPPSDGHGFVYRSAVGQVKLDIVNDAGIISFRKVK